MSSATDVLMYIAGADEPTMVKFNEHLAREARFGAHPWRVDQSEFAGPNIFGGQVWAFGADYMPADMIKDAIDSVRWRRPQNVVALVTFIDGHGICETEVVRPDYIVVEPDSYMESASILQDVKGPTGTQ